MICVSDCNQSAPVVSASDDQKMASQLQGYFGTSDLLQILMIKDKEAYLNAPQDVFTARMGYLRAVIRHHPDSHCISPRNPDQKEDYELRIQKLFILRDIYEFLTSEKEDQLKERDKYFGSGELPTLMSLEILSDKDKCRKRFGLADFERAATELKEIFMVQMRRVQDQQQENP